MSKTITISDELYNEIEKLIQDDQIKRNRDYKSVQDFMITNIEESIEADKDAAGIKD